MTNPPLTGPEAIHYALTNLDLEALEAEQRQVIRDKKKTARPRAVRLINVLDGLRKNKLDPADLMLNSVPVIPPRFRPFSVTGNTFLPGDSNELYKDLVEYRRLYQRTEDEMGRAGAGEVYADMNQAVRAAYGYGDSPNPKTRARSVKGFFDVVTGSNPKSSFYISKMLSKPVDTVGRGVVVPDADYDMDEVGIPKDMAWKLYSQYAQRRMVRGGMSPGGALKHITDRSPQALKALQDEFKVRPVVLTRSPAWYKFNVIGQNPRMIDGDAIKVNTFCTEGLNMDFDGDFQHTYVVFAMPNKLVSNLLLFNLTPVDNAGSLPRMFNHLSLPIIDPATHSVFIADLEDFPRGPLLREKQGEKSFIQFYDAVPGTKVIAMDELSGLPVWADVSHFSVHTGPPIEIVSLEAHRQIFTDDDPRAVYGIDPNSGALELGRFTPAEALKRRVVVPFVKNTHAVLASLEGLTSVTVTDNPECIFRELPLTWDTGWMLGALTGGGWWDKRDSGYCDKRLDMFGKRTLHLADLQGYNAGRLDNVLKLILGVSRIRVHRQESLKEDHPDRYGDTVKFSYNFLHSEELTKFLDVHLGGERDDNTSGSANKHVPNFLFQANEDFRKGFLCGLVDTGGTCSVSMGKGKPQLMCAFSSTSLRLCREVQLLCSSLGISAPVAFSKVTTAGNTSWIVTMSTPDCKRINIFDDLISPWKRDNFKNTPVAMGSTSEMFDKVVLPRHIADRVMHDLHSPKIRKEERGGSSAELLFRMDEQNIYQQWNAAGKAGAVTRATVGKVLSMLKQQETSRKHAVAEALTLLSVRLEGGTMTQEVADALREGIRGLCPKQDTTGRYAAGVLRATSLNQPLRLGKGGRKVFGTLNTWMTSTVPYLNALHDPEVQGWIRKFVDNRQVCWSPVVSVEYTGQPETGYDLTVPGYETFMSADGVILSNTSSIHVPSSSAAVKDVRDKIMASKMLWSIKDRTKTMGSPKHEQIVGLNMGRTGGRKHSFGSEDEAMKAIEAGGIDMNDDIEIGDQHG